MTAAEFRRMALKLPDAIEASHMGHPDFRVGGKVFATLGYPSDRFGTVMLSPQDQDLMARDYPKTFAPVAGGWGAARTTTIVLRGASKRAVAIALEAAWRKRAPKQLAATPGRSGTTKSKAKGDTAYARLRKICLSLPDTEEGTAWGHPAFRVKGKMFCVYEQIKGTWTIGFKMAPLHASLRERDPAIVAALDYGKHRSLFMDAARIRDWDDVRDAIIESYRLSAPTRSLAKLDADAG